MCLIERKNPFPMVKRLRDRYAVSNIRLMYSYRWSSIELGTLLKFGQMLSKHLERLLTDKTELVVLSRKMCKSLNSYPLFGRRANIHYAQLLLLFKPLWVASAWRLSQHTGTWVKISLLPSWVSLNWKWTKKSHGLASSVGTRKVFPKNPKKRFRGTCYICGKHDHYIGKWISNVRREKGLFTRNPFQQ